MNKKILLLPLLMLLTTGCAGGESELPSSSETPSITTPTDSPSQIEKPSETPVVPASDLQSMLDEMKTGFAANNRLISVQDYGINSSGVRDFVYSTWCKDTQTSNLHTFAKKYKQNSISDEDFENGNITFKHDEADLQQSYIFTRAPETDHLATTYLGIDNEMHYEIVKNSASTLPYLYSQTFENPFAHLKAEFFTKVSDTEYQLKENDYLLDRIYTTLAHYIYGEITNFKVESFSLLTDGKKITGYKGDFKPLSSTAFTLTETITFEADVTSVGEASYTVPTTLPDEPIAELEEAFASLRKNNYDVKSTGERNGWYGKTTTVTEASTNGNEVIRKDYAENMEALPENLSKEYYFKGYQEDYYGSKLDYVSKSVKLNGEYYYATTPIRAKFADEMLPKFNLSSCLFEPSQEKDTYELRLDLPYYFLSGTTSNFSLVGNNGMEGLKVKLTDGTVTFETTPEEYGTKEIIVYSNIGKVSATLVNEEQVHKTSEGVLNNIVDYCSTQKEKDELNKRFGTDLLKLIPVPGGTNNDMTTYFAAPTETVTKGQLRISLDANDPDYNTDNLLVRYANVLITNGFVYGPEDISGYYYNKKVEKDGKNYDFEISFGLSNSSLFIVDLVLESISV